MIKIFLFKLFTQIQSANNNNIISAFPILANNAFIFDKHLYLIASKAALLFRFTEVQFALLSTHLSAPITAQYAALTTAIIQSKY